MDAYNRCVEKGGTITIKKVGPKGEKRRVCSVKGWGPVAESVDYKPKKKKNAKRKKGGK